MRRSKCRTARDEWFAVKVGATAFRRDGSVAAVTITDISFDGCQMSSENMFEIGEVLRLYLSGQGCVDAEVHWTLNDRAGARFLIECKSGYYLPR